MTLETFLRYRRPGFVFEIGTIERVNRPETAQVEEAVDPVDVGRLELELADEQV